MKVLYFECFSGISGNMALAALNDLGVPEEYLFSELKKLGVGGFRIEFERVVKNGISANYANVILEDSSEHSAHRTHADIERIIEASGITDGAKKMAKDIFKTIAVAEAKVHNTTPDHVHFHEVGALDSIADIVGVAICIDYLKPGKIIAGTVSDGHGFIECRHGIIPVPVPAVVEIFAAKNIKAKRLDIEAELVTPTGAGIIAALADFKYPEDGLAIKKVGYGAGTRDLTIPNVLRICLCDEHCALNETIAVIEANIDNQTPESLGFAMEQLFTAGALDVFFTPIYMKKNRPAVKLSVICKNGDAEKMYGIIFENTSTIGVRIREEKRACLERESIKAQTNYGEIDVKISYYGKYRKVSPEFESAKKAAIEHGVPLEDVYGSIYESMMRQNEF